MGRCEHLDRTSRVGGGLGPFGEPTNVDRVPEHRGGVEEALDRLVHAANDTGRMTAGTIRRLTVAASTWEERR